MIEVDVPGVGTVEFPDGTAKDKMLSAIGNYKNRVASTGIKLGTSIPGVIQSAMLNPAAVAASEAGQKSAEESKRRILATPSSPMEWSAPLSGQSLRGVGSGISQALNDQGQAVVASTADLGSLLTGQPLSNPGVPSNVQAWANRQPLPAETQSTALPTAARIPLSAVQGTIASLPRMGAAAGLTAAGVPPPLAAGLAFGPTDRGFDVKQAALAAAAPIVGKYTGAITEALASKLRIGNDAALEVLNKLGGGTGAAALMSADQLHHIASLPPGQRKDAIIEAIGQVAPMAILGMAAERTKPAEAIRPLQPLAAAAAMRAPKFGPADVEAINRGPSLSQSGRRIVPPPEFVPLEKGLEFARGGEPVARSIEERRLPPEAPRQQPTFAPSGLAMKPPGYQPSEPIVPSAAETGTIQPPSIISPVASSGSAAQSVRAMAAEAARRTDFARAVAEKVAQEHEPPIHPDKPLTGNQLRIVQESLTKAVLDNQIPGPRRGLIAGSPLEAWANDRLSGGNANTAGPDVVAALLVRGAAAIERGITNFADWSKDMIGQFGDTVKPYLEHLFEQSKAFHAQSVKAKEPEPIAPEQSAAASKPLVARMGNAGHENQFGDPGNTVYHATPDDWKRWQELTTTRRALMDEKRLNDLFPVQGEIEKLKNKYGGMPPEAPSDVPQNTVTLYHAEGAQGGGGSDTRFFSRDPQRAASFGGNVYSVEVPESVANEGASSRQSMGLGTSGDVVLPRQWADKAKLMDNPPAQTVHEIPTEDPEIPAAASDQPANLVMYTGLPFPELKPLVKPLIKARNVLQQRFWNRAARHDMDQAVDSADNRAAVVGQRMGKRVSIGTSPVSDRAGSVAIATGFDRAKLSELAAKVKGKNKEAEEAIQWAMAHWGEAQRIGKLGQAVMDWQLRSENGAGITTLHAENYLPGIYDTDLWMGDKRPYVISGRGGTGSSFKKGKTYATPFDAIADGYTPQTLRLSELVQHRVSQGQKMINRRSLTDIFKGITAASDGKPVATDVETVSRGRRLPSFERVQAGYVMRDLLPGHRLGIHEDFASLFDAVTGQRSAIHEFEPGGVPIGSISLSLEGGVKHGLLVFDTFHASRIMQKQMFLTGKLPSWTKGASLLEYSTEDLDRAVAAGDLTSDMAKWIKGNKPEADLLLNAGYNVGRIQEGLYSSFTRQWQEALSKGARRLGVPRGLAEMMEFNKWVFEKVTRGAMMEAGLVEMRRVAKNNPEWTSQKVAKTVARDLNVYFGNIGRQGIFKSPTWMDASRLALLAPQWAESMARSEILGAKDIASASIDAAMRRRLAVGSLGAGMSRGLFAYVIGTQLLNLVTRGHPTWENKEPGHKLDAWVPDVSGKSGGYFVSPYGVVAELTHDMIRYGQRDNDYAEALNQIRRNRMSPLWRAGAVLLTGRDWRDQKIPNWSQRIVQAGLSVAPLPLPAQGLTSPTPGAAQRQLMASLGVKAEAAQRPSQTVFDLAMDWMKHSQDPKTAEKYALRQKQDFGESQYKPLRMALSSGNLQAARKAYDQLRASGTAPKDIARTLNPMTSTSEGVSVHKPVAGLSRREMAAFVRSLSPTEKEFLMKSIADRKTEYAAFRKMLAETKAPLADTPERRAMQ